MSKPIRSEKLFILQNWQWQHALTFIDPQHLIALIVVAHHVLVGDALETREGRAELKEIFRQALAEVPSLEGTPEFRRAMVVVNLVDNVQRREDAGEVIDPAELKAIAAYGLAQLPDESGEIDISAGLEPKPEVN